MAQINQSGFERDNRQDLTRRINNAMRDKFGANLLLTDDSIAGLIRSLLVERELDWQRLLEDVYYSRTLNGAEGVALDDAASYYGFLRQGAQPGGGTAHIEFTSTATNLATQIQDTDTFSASNGITYSVIQGTALNQSITGAIIDVNVLSADDYEFFIENVVEGGVEETTLTLASTDQADVNAFATEVVNFIITYTEGNASSVFHDSGVIYVGYGSTDEFIALAQPIYFESPDLPTGFTWWAGYNVEANENGFNPLEAGGISGFNRSFDGYQSATNTQDFLPGAENETDAEFILRLQTTRGRTPTATRDAVERALINVNNVIGARVYDNPTLVDRPEASALSFNAVVRGGNDVDIANAIYNAIPFNTKMSGDTTVQLETFLGQQKEIRFTKASQRLYDIQVEYTVNNTTPLSSREVRNIETAVDNFLEDRPIGLSVTNTQLTSAVLSSLPAGRLLNVNVFVKRPEEGTNSFSQSDLGVAFDEFVAVNQYSYERIV